MSGADHHVG
jgi:hypothetical protein